MTDKIPPGYKKTDIGIIPEDWEVKRLGEVGEAKGGNGFPLKYQGRQKGEYPFFKVINLSQDGNKVFLRNADHWIDEHIRKMINAQVFPKNTIVFAKIGAAVFLERKRILTQKSCIDNNMMGFIPDKSKVDPLFLYYVFTTLHISKLVEATALPSISSEEIENTQIPLPPLPEQRAIARILSDFDALIESLDNLIEKKKFIKKGAMQELLTGKKRLPGFKGKWVRKRLGDILQYEQPTKYIVKSTEYLENGFVPVLTPGKTFILGYTDEKNGIYRDVPVIIFDDFTTASKYVTFPFKVKSSALKILKLRDENNDLKFIYEKMQLIDYQISEGDHKRRWIAEYQNIEIVIPPTLAEQHAIAQILSDMDAEIEALEQKKKKYEMMKKGAMELLLTGKVRVKEENEKIEVIK